MTETTTFTLTIRCDSAAFAEDGLGGAEDNLFDETARILRRIAADLESRTDDFSFFRTLFDCNGNDVGRAKFVRGQA